MSEPTVEQREQGQRIVGEWCAAMFNRLKQGEEISTPKGSLTDLANRIARALAVEAHHE